MSENKRVSDFLKAHHVILFLVFSLFVVFGRGQDQRACATMPALPTDVPASCDPEFYQVMRAQAWLGANRDNETAQRLLLKGDSVLQYSCFEPSINLTAQSIGVFTSDEYDDTYERAVVDANTGYLEGSFNHNAGGGSTPLAYSPCFPMAAVWQVLKCANFDKVDFRTFAEIQGDDRRVFPDVCPAAGARATLWQNYIDLANPPAGPAPAPAGAMDIMIPHTDYTTWSAGGSCGAPIPTGLLNQQMQPDAVCALPGCFYTGGGCSG